MTNAEARFNKSLHPWKPEGSLGRTAQDVHLDSHTAPELCVCVCVCVCVHLAHMYIVMLEPLWIDYVYMYQYLSRGRFC